MTQVINTINSPTRWIVIEVKENGEDVEVFIEPGTLRLPEGFVGDIVWQVFTPGWELVDVSFLPDSLFNGTPEPDPVRIGCWRTAASNDGSGASHYTLTVRPEGDPTRETICVDPVVENDPPPPSLFVSGDVTRARPRKEVRRLVQ